MMTTAVRLITDDGLETDRFEQHQSAEEREDAAAEGEGPPLRKSDVAALSDEEIRRMSRAVLVKVILTLRPWECPSDIAARLPFQDRALLQRLSFQARRTCRRQGY